jgi:Ca2+-binding EF-hand superfamily protein
MNFDQFIEIMMEKKISIDKQNLREYIGQIFNLFDDNLDGKINLTDIKKIALDIGETISDFDLELLMTYGKEVKGEINVEEFYEIMKLQ